MKNISLRTLEYKLGRRKAPWRTRLGGYPRWFLVSSLVLAGFLFTTLGVAAYTQRTRIGSVLGVQIAQKKGPISGGALTCGGGTPIPNCPESDFNLTPGFGTLGRGEYGFYNLHRGDNFQVPPYSGTHDNVYRHVEQTWDPNMNFIGMGEVSIANILIPLWKQDPNSPSSPDIFDYVDTTTDFELDLSYARKPQPGVCTDANPNNDTQECWTTPGGWDGFGAKGGFSLSLGTTKKNAQGLDRPATQTILSNAAPATTNFQTLSIPFKFDPKLLNNTYWGPVSRPSGLAVVLFFGDGINSSWFVNHLLVKDVTLKRKNGNVNYLAQFSKKGAVNGNFNCVGTLTTCTDWVITTSVEPKDAFGTATVNRQLDLASTNYRDLSINGPYNADLARVYYNNSNDQNIPGLKLPGTKTNSISPNSVFVDQKIDTGFNGLSFFFLGQVKTNSPCAVNVAHSAVGFSFEDNNRNGLFNPASDPRYFGNPTPPNNQTYTTASNSQPTVGCGPTLGVTPTSMQLTINAGDSTPLTFPSSPLTISNLAGRVDPNTLMDWSVTGCTAAQGLPAWLTCTGSLSGSLNYGDPAATIEIRYSGTHPVPLAAANSTFTTNLVVTGVQHTTGTPAANSPITVPVTLRVVIQPPNVGGILGFQACLNQPKTFVANDVTGYQAAYHWDFGPSGIANPTREPAVGETPINALTPVDVASVPVTYSAIGTYNVSFTITNLAGQTVSQPHQVQVKECGADYTSPSEDLRFSGRHLLNVPPGLEDRAAQLFGWQEIPGNITP